jgi:ornithine cyclodeaminase
MIYLNDRDIRQIGISWPLLAERIERVLALSGSDEVVQPLKPYLRFGKPGNRIIAMPAFVGGDAPICGIKWIASFPGNLADGLPRAHGTIVLNHPSNGVPAAILNGGLLNGLRTAAVSAVMLRAFLRLRRRARYRIGLIGWGPIGRRQLEMTMALFGDAVEDIRLFDIRGIEEDSLDENIRSSTTLCASWQEVFRNSDILFTCTAATESYIDEPALTGSLLMNVSLRDYKPGSVRDVQPVVDNWQEVCRENTDIERLHLEAGLAENDALTLRNVVHEDALHTLDPERPIFFNPMGMAAFDMAIAAHYWREALRLGIGIRLE